MNKAKLASQSLENGNGIVRLAPTWVPRAFLSPAGRLKLSSQDLYILGANRGGIDERWFASTVKADNPGAPEDEGLSYIVVSQGSKVEKVLLRDAFRVAGDEFLGKKLMREYDGWPIFSKFFENSCPIPLHLHLCEKDARRVNRKPKPEAYYFPPQLNAVEGRFPYTFFGLHPGTTREDVKRCLERWNMGDNGILELSKAYRLRAGTSWVIPAGTLHAPGTLVTYEPQWASDVAALFQSMLDGAPISWGLLTKDVPPEHHHDLDYIVDLIDWEVNLDPEFRKHHFIEPKPVGDLAETRRLGYEEKWVVYGSQEFSTKELTVLPKKSVTVVDKAAYALIVVQGHGSLGSFDVESPTMIRYGQLTNDEFFVTIGAAKDGVKIRNLSSSENLVVLRQFGPDNPDASKLIQK
jgi:hypothetical protein